MRPFFYNLSVEGNCLKVVIFGPVEKKETQVISRAIEANLNKKVKRIHFDLTNVDKIGNHFCNFFSQLKSTFGIQGIVAVKYANNVIRRALNLTGIEQELLGINKQPENLIKNPSLRKFINAHFQSLISKQIALVAYANRGSVIEAKNLAAIINKSYGRIVPHLKSLTESGLLVVKRKNNRNYYHFAEDRNIIADFMQFLASLNDPHFRRLIRIQIHLNWQQAKKDRGIPVTQPKVIDFNPSRLTDNIS